MSGSQGTFARLSDELVETAAAAARSIVQVLGRPRRPASGVVVAPGRVVTTSHSVEWEEGVGVATDDGTRLEGTVVGHARGADLVLLNVPGLSAPAVAIDGGSSRAGELALLAGRTWRGQPSARLVMIGSIAGSIQTRDGTRIDGVLTLNTSPYPGFSGSALIGRDGVMVGLATAGIVRGAALALPGAVVTPLARAIEEHGGIRRGYLGVVGQPARVPVRQRGTIAQEQALVVVGVSPDGPADRAGLQVGDIMMQAAGAALEAPEDLLTLLAPERVGQPLELLVLRGATAHTVTVTVGERPSRM